jgi:hypothetical protein
LLAPVFGDNGGAPQPLRDVIEAGEPPEDWQEEPESSQPEEPPEEHALAWWEDFEVSGISGVFSRENGGQLPLSWMTVAEIRQAVKDSPDSTLVSILGKPEFLDSLYRRCNSEFSMEELTADHVPTLQISLPQGGTVYLPGIPTEMYGGWFSDYLCAISVDDLSGDPELITSGQHSWPGVVLLTPIPPGFQRGGFTASGGSKIPTVSVLARVHSWSAVGMTLTRVFQALADAARQADGETDAPPSDHQNGGEHQLGRA